MEPTRDRLSESSEPQRSLTRDLDRIKTDGSASIEEIREFFARMKGKSPQQMLGVVAQSGLAVSILWATLGCAVLLVTSTLFSYARWGDGATETQAGTKSRASSTQSKSGDSVAGAAKTASQPSGKTPDIANKLGHTTTKSGAPDIDNLIDGNK